MTCWAAHWHRDGGSRHRKLRALALAGTSALVLMLAAGEARAEPVDWVGDALKEDPVTGLDVPDDAWNNPDNWTPKKIPTGDDEVTVSVNGEPTGVMIDGGSAIAKSLTITGATVAGAALTVRNGATLTVDRGDGNGTIDLRSYLVIGNNIFGTGGIAPGTVDASVLDIASTGVLVFDHNDTSGEYAFAPWISGDGGIEVLSGSTRLTGLNIYNGGTEIKALATLRGDSNSLIGGIEGESLDFGGTIFASTLIIGPGGFGELRINTDGGVVAIQNGDFIIPNGASVGADRLVIDSANVTVAAGATLGSGQPSFVASSRFEGGGRAETLLINSQVSFDVGSNMAFGGAWNLQFVSGVILDLDNDANFDNAVISGLSGDSHSGLEVREGTTLNIFSNGDAGTFGSALVGEGTILKSGQGSWTVQQNNASTFSGTLHVGFGATVEGLPILEDGRPAAGLELAGLLLVDEEASAYVAGTVGSADISGNWGISRDGTPGTLAVTGNMILNPMSVLTMNLGAPGGLPGLDSDLITLGGDLTLDGVLLVEDAGGFGFGLYRLFEYGGALTDNSLEIVGIPAGFSIFDFNVSTIHRGTVNLLVGDQGGGGEPPEMAMFPEDTDTWQPDDFDPATTVIFQGEGRTISLPGEVSRFPGGIQFADDGFELTPGGVGGHILFELDPLGEGAPIRVGDGTAAGADMTATIGVNLSGIGGFTKTDLGTLILTGFNSYAGGTRVQAGTLVGDADSLQGAIDISEPSTLQFDQLAAGTFAGDLTGNGNLVKTGAGTLTLQAGSAWSVDLDLDIRDGVLRTVTDTPGVTAGFDRVTIAGGAGLTVGQDTTLQVGGLAGVAGSVIFLDDGSVLDLDGDCSHAGGIAGGGTLAVRCDLTLLGDVSGFSGEFYIEDTRVVRFDEFADGTFEGDFAGEGAIVKLGTGTLILTGTVGHTGGTTVEEGTLGGATVNLQGFTVNSLQGNIDIGSLGTVLFEQDADGLFSGTLTGAGAVAKTGTGTLTLQPDSTWSVDLDLDIRDGVLRTVTDTPDVTAGFDRVMIAGGAGLTVGPDTTLEIGGLAGAAGSVIFVDDGSFLELDGDCSHAGDLAGTGTIILGCSLLDSDLSDFDGEWIIPAGHEADFYVNSHPSALRARVRGEGTLVKSGIATFELLDGLDADVSGDVRVEDGTLLIDGENLPAVFEVEIFPFATLAFNQTADQSATLSGTALGGGGIVKIGDGTLTLETNSNWSRVLTLDIDEGEVRVEAAGSGGSAAFAGASIADGAVLTVGSDTTVEVGVLTGAAGSRISLDDGSILDLDGDCSHAGEIVGTGTLAVRCDLTLAGDSPDFLGDVEVGDGARLTIDGTIGSELSEEQQVEFGRIMRFVNGSGLNGVGHWLGTVLADPGSTVAPGNSIGTLSVGGIVFNTGSTFEVELSDGGNTAGVHNDLLAVTGAATIDGGTVHVTPENGTDTGSTYAPGTVYTVLTAGGGVSGTFDTLTDDYAFLNFALSYDASGVFLTSSLADLCLTGFTANQCAVADAVETLGAAALFTAVTNLSGAEAPVAMNRLSGEVHASAATALIEDSRFAREASLARLRVALSSVGASRNGIAERQASNNVALWGQAFGARGEWTGNGNAAAMDRSIGGFFMGGDVAIADTARLGAFGGYQTSGFDVDDRSASGKADTFTLGGYGGGQWGPLGLRLGAAYGWSEAETQRMVTFTGFSGSLSASRDTRLAQVHAEAGYRIDVAGVSFEPFANLAYVHFETDGFTEAGGQAALTAADQNMDMTFATVGVRGEARVAVGTTEAALHGTAGWRHAFDDAMPISRQAFAMGGEAFSVAGVLIAEEAFVLDAGVDVKLTPSVTLGLGYSGQFGSGVTDQGAKAHFAVRF